MNDNNFRYNSFCSTTSISSRFDFSTRSYYSYFIFDFDDLSNGIISSRKNNFVPNATNKLVLCRKIKNFLSLPDLIWSCNWTLGFQPPPCILHHHIFSGKFLYGQILLSEWHVMFYFPSLPRQILILVFIMPLILSKYSTSWIPWTWIGNILLSTLILFTGDFTKYLIFRTF